eukprot:365590-Chlamydomonas_euryale.AAC.1
MLRACVVAASGFVLHAYVGLSSRLSAGDARCGAGRALTAGAQAATATSASVHSAGGFPLRSAGGLPLTLACGVVLTSPRRCCLPRRCAGDRRGRVQRVCLAAERRCRVSSGRARRLCRCRRRAHGCEGGRAGCAHAAPVFGLAAGPGPAYGAWGCHAFTARAGAVGPGRRRSGRYERRYR